VDGSKCISYFTIELKENIPQEMKGKFEGLILSRRLSLNKFSKPHNEPLFNPKCIVDD
jgi:epoxyqueuosine reductase